MGTAGCRRKNPDTKNLDTKNFYTYRKDRRIMVIENKEFGRIEIRDIPLPWESEDISGTYT